jgi:5-methylcytosine-specific restriction endonuclease McrA
MQLPRYVDNLPVSKFKKFLVNCGGQLLHETNQYEVIRVKCDKGVEILYCKSSGQLTWSKELVNAYIAYKSGGTVKWRGSRKKKISRRRGSVLLQTLFRRDGNKCWFCHRELNIDTATIEHLLNVSNGGNNHVNNLTIACNTCNQKARNMCITSKVELRDKILAGHRL